MKKLDNEVANWIWTHNDKQTYYRWPQGQLFDFLKTRYPGKVHVSVIELLTAADTLECPFSYSKVGYLLKQFNIGYISIIGD